MLDMMPSCLQRLDNPRLQLLDEFLNHIPQAIRSELANVDGSAQGISKYRFEDIEDCDLSIWQTQSKGPALVPGKGTLMPGHLEQRYQSWETEDENVLFQR